VNKDNCGDNCVLLRSHDKRYGCGTEGGCFTEVFLHSSKFYHQVHATEPSRLPVTREWPLRALYFYVSMELPICISINL
jgi:hypothetical protein